MSEPTQLTPNKKLRHERERRCWSQQEVADMVGTTPLNVSRWERGINTPNPYFRQKLCAVFEKTAQELGLVPSEAQQSKSSESATITSQPVTAPSPSPEVPAALWNVPYRRNLFFTGREDILQQLRETLVSDEHPVALTQSLAISGLGGIGKTQTAVEYAYRYRDNYTTVLWARADSHDVLVSDYLTIASLLSLPERNEQDQNKIVKAVLRWFDTHSGWLLILDNADNLETVSAFIPSSGKGHVLLTTRASSTGTVAQRIDIEKMGLYEGTLFLLRRTKRLKGNAPPETLSQDMRKQALAIAEELDGLPLALDQAGAYIEETGCSFPDYLKFYKTHRKRLLRSRGRDVSGHPEPVATTWALSFEKVEQANPAAAELLRLSAFLHPDEIPEAMIAEGAPELGPVLQPIAADDLEFNEAIGELHKYSLMKRDAEKKILNVHRLVQAVVRDRMEKETEKGWAERVVRMVNRAFPEVELIEQQRYQLYVSQAQTCKAMIEQWHLFSSDAAQLLHQLGHNLARHAQYRRAETIILHALAMREQLLGLEHPDVAETLTNLGALYTTQGKYDQAELFIQQGLSIREKVLGTHHSSVANSLYRLAFLYCDQGKYGQAKTLLHQALLIAEQTVGSFHLDTAEILNLQAITYWHQGKYEQAEVPLLRALHIREQILGSNNEAVAYSLNDIGVLYDNQGKYTQAEAFYLRSLAMKEQTSAEDNPDLATTISNLALFYSRRGKYAEAESLHQRALEMRKRMFGQEHPEIATSLNHLGVLYYEQGKYAETEALWLQALAIRQRCLGPEHPDVAESFHNLASLYRILGQYTQAETFFLRAIALREQLLGPVHPHLAQSLTNFAKLSREMGRYGQAEALLLRALPIREQVLGVMHPDVAFTIQNLGDLHRLQGNYAEAEKMYLRALTIREQALPSGHPDIASTLVGLAQVYQKRENYGQAEELFRRALLIQEQALGTDYLGIAETVCSLASLYQDQGLYEQAEPLFQRSLAIREGKLGPDHPDIEKVLVPYSILLQKTNREAEAVALEERAATIRAKPR